MQPMGQDKEARTASINRAALEQRYLDNVAKEDSSDSDDSDDSDSDEDSDEEASEAQPKKPDPWSAMIFYQGQGKNANIIGY